MRIKSIGSNQTLVIYDKLEVLVSYETPVAGHIHEVGYFKTDTKHSQTTSRHINQYIGDNKARIVSQKEVQKRLDNAANRGNVGYIAAPTEQVQLATVKQPGYAIKYIDNPNK